jgi:hypothetical protein
MVAKPVFDTARFRICGSTLARKVGRGRTLETGLLECRHRLHVRKDTLDADTARSEGAVIVEATNFCGELRKLRESVVG